MNTEMFIIGLLAVWVTVNILYMLRRNSLRDRVEVKYYIILILRKKYSGRLGESKSPLLGYIFTVLYFLAFALSVYVTIVAIHNGLNRGDRGVVVLLPGLNITGLDLLYFLISAFIGVSLHEYLHARIALRNSIPVKSYGFILALILPAAFVEIDEEIFRKTGRLARISTLSAGIIANLAIVIIVLAISALIRPVLVSPHGLTVVEVSENSLAYEYGLKQYDVILELNDVYASIDYLRTILSVNETITIDLDIYRDGVGYMKLTIVKPYNVTKLGVILDQAPSEKVLGVIPVWLVIFILRQLSWLYIVNFSLMYINALPLFITDGGRIINETLGERKGKIVNYVSLALLIAMLFLNARI